MRWPTARADGPRARSARRLRHAYVKVHAGSAQPALRLQAGLGRVRFPDGTGSTPIWCRHSWALEHGARTPSSRRSAGIGMLQLWVQQPGDAVGSALCRARPGRPVSAHRPRPGYLPGAAGYDYAGDGSFDARTTSGLRRMAMFGGAYQRRTVTSVKHRRPGLRGRPWIVSPRRTSCAPCCEIWAGKPIDEAKFCRRLPGFFDALGGPLAEALAGRSPAAEIGAAPARRRCWTNR